MAKLNPTQIAIVNAVSAFKNGSRGLVVMFEEVISAYWSVDGCNPHNVEFFLNAIKRFPQIQQAVRTMLLPRFGKFTIKLTSEAGKEKAYSVVNFKPKDNTEQGLTKADKVKFREEVRKFIAEEHTSLLHDKQVANKIEKAFDMDKTAASIRNNIQSQIKKAIESGANLDILKNLINKSVSEAFSSDSVKAIKEKASKAA